MQKTAVRWVPSPKERPAARNSLSFFMAHLQRPRPLEVTGSRCSGFQFTADQEAGTFTGLIGTIRTAFAVIQSPVLLLPISLSEIVDRRRSGPIGTPHLIFMAYDVKAALTRRPVGIRSALR